MLLGERPLGPDNSLGNGLLPDQEGTRNLVGRQTTEQAERKRNARLGRQNRMAGREHEAQESVADVIVDRGVEFRDGHLLLSRKLTTRSEEHTSELQSRGHLV